MGGEERVYGESGVELAGFQQGLTLSKKVGEQEWKVAYGESVSAYPSSDYEHAIDEKIEELAAGE